MNIERNPTKQRCQAMIDAGIEDPVSAEGIMFCAGDRFTESKCPYSHCVMDDYAIRAEEAESKKLKAIALHNYGVSIRDIVLILGRKTNTIKGYLRSERLGKKD